jgi:hypothetical protein
MQNDRSAGLLRVLEVLTNCPITCGPPSLTRALAACEEVEVGLGQGGRVLQRDVVTGRGDDGAVDVAGHLRELLGYFVPEIGLRADGRVALHVGQPRAQRLRGYLATVTKTHGENLAA